MSEQAVDAITRRAAAALSRRSSLAALSGVALAASLMAPANEVRAVKGKKKKKKCQKQLGQCEEAVEEFCNSLTSAPPPREAVTGEGSCESHLSECCSHFTSCHAREGVECLLERVVDVLQAT